MSALAALRGADTYAGTWVPARPGDPIDLSGGRVGLLGDPAGVVALAADVLARVDALTVFYADPVLVLPTRDLPVVGDDARHGVLATARRVLGRAPAPVDDPVAAAAQRYRRAEVADRWLRRQLTPHPQDVDVPVVRSDDFYAALRDPRCSLVTWPVADLSERGVRTADGLEHHLDVLVLAQPGA